jgi:hypothetical protein
MLSVTPTASRELIVGGPSYPSIAAVCLVCGNTQLHNVFVLGIAEALGVTKTEEKREKNG